MISKFLKILGLQPQISIFFSRSLQQFLLTVGQNNFGNKIPILTDNHFPKIYNFVIMAREVTFRQILNVGRNCWSKQLSCRSSQFHFLLHYHKNIFDSFQSRLIWRKKYMYVYAVCIYVSANERVIQTNANIYIYFFLLQMSLLWNESKIFLW